MKKLFCKHRWAMIYAQIDTPLQIDGNFVRCGIKFGVVVYCTKCGKQHNRLSKKIGKILANSYADNFEEHARKVTYTLFREMSDEKS